MCSAWLPACEGVPVWWCKGILDTSDEMWILLGLNVANVGLNVDQMLACLCVTKRLEVKFMYMLLGPQSFVLIELCVSIWSIN